MRHLLVQLKVWICLGAELDAGEVFSLRMPRVPARSLTMMLRLPGRAERPGRRTVLLEVLARAPAE